MSKKSIIRLLAALLAVIVAAATLAGCTQFRQKAISTEKSTEIYSNGGLAVQYGKYLYYINGFAGAGVENEWGAVQKGAIYRAELKNGVPDYNTNVCVVPKNVYGTDAKTGFFIQDDYIYYSTPSTKKDKSGAAMSSHMVLMRTKVDGTDTKIVAEFNTFSISWKPAGSYILYVKESTELHQISLNTKKFEDKEIAKDVTGFVFTSPAGFSMGGAEGYAAELPANAFSDAVFYTKSAEKETDTFNEVFCFRAGGSPTRIITKDSYGDTLLDENGYTITVVAAKYTAAGVRLIYNKTNGSANKLSAGTYSYDFGAELAFNVANEIRYSATDTYTDLVFLDDNNVLAVHSSRVDFLTGKLKNPEITSSNHQNGYAEITQLVDVAITFFKYEEADGTVVLWFVESNQIKRMAVLSYAVVDNVKEYKVARKSVEFIFAGSYNTTWQGLDRITKNIVVFFSATFKDNAYYIDLSVPVPRDNDTKYPTLFGAMTNEDIIGLL